MATFAISTEREQRRHTMYGKVIGRRVTGTRFFLWYLPSGGSQFTRAVGGPYDTTIEARRRRTRLRSTETRHTVGIVRSHGVTV